MTLRMSQGIMAGKTALKMTWTGTRSH